MAAHAAYTLHGVHAAVRYNLDNFENRPYWAKFQLLRHFCKLQNRICRRDFPFLEWPIQWPIQVCFVAAKNTILSIGVTYQSRVLLKFGIQGAIFQLTHLPSHSTRARPAFCIPNFPGQDKRIRLRASPLFWVCLLDLTGEVRRDCLFCFSYFLNF